VVNGKLYVFGGYPTSSQVPQVRSDVYDPVADSWTRIADMPRKLTHAGVAVDGRNVYFAGGYIGTAATGYAQQFGTEEVWRYNVDTNQYTRMTDLPARLAGGGLVVVGRNLHYFGGNNASRQDVAGHYALNLDNPAAGWTTNCCGRLIPAFDAVIVAHPETDPVRSVNDADVCPDPIVAPNGTAAIDE
jgi:hypothetical protein